MTKKYVKSDDVNVITLKLSSADGKKNYDLSAQVVEFSIYEDIMFPVVRAEFTLIDALDLLTKFPIIGEEIIEVEFETPGYDLSCSYKFHVNSIENQTTAAQGKSKAYVLRAFSEEFITNNTKFVGEKKSGSSEHLIQDMMNNYLGTKKTIAGGDPTKGTQQVLLSRMRPFQIVDFIRKRSVSLNYNSSSYVFFENKRGFNFSTIEYLLHKQQDNVKDKVFFYDTAGNSDARNMNTRNIIHLQNISQVDNTKKITQGSLNNVVKKFDLLTGEIVTTNYKNSEKQSQFKLGSKKPLGLNTSSFEKKFGEEAATSMLVPHSSDLPDNYIDSAMGAKHSFVTKMGQNIYQVYVNGDTALTAGDVITINVPSATGDTGSTQTNRLIAGNYLVSKLRHIVVNVSSNQKSYTVSMELIKGFQEDYS